LRWPPAGAGDRFFRVGEFELAPNWPGASHGWSAAVWKSQRQQPSPSNQWASPTASRLAGQLAAAGLRHRRAPAPGLLLNLRAGRPGDSWKQLLASPNLELIPADFSEMLEKGNC